MPLTKVGEEDGVTEYWGTVPGQAEPYHAYVGPLTPDMLKAAGRLVQLIVDGLARQGRVPAPPLFTEKPVEVGRG